MLIPVREAGGGLPSLGALYGETFQDLTQNIQGYLMVGLALIAVVMPVSFLVGFVGVFVMYAAMGAGIVASVAGGGAIGDATGDRDLGGLVAGVGSIGAIIVGFLVFFALIAVMSALFAPLSASLYRAVAAHQRGETPLTFGGAFSTVKQDIVPTAMVLLLVTGASFLGVMFCYVGVFVPMVLFSFAFMMVALHRKGALEALRISARHAMARPSEHLVYVLAVFGTSLVAAYIPLLGPMFLIALNVRAYRKMFGDGAEPMLE